MIYLDACLLIYLVEHGDEDRGADVKRRMRDEQHRRFAISLLVRMECLVKPLRDGNVVLQTRYERVLERLALLDEAARGLSVTIAPS